MSGSRYEYVYNSALTASGAILLFQFGNLSGLFGAGLTHRGWLYASLATNIIAIVFLLGRKMINTYEEGRKGRVQEMSAEDMIKHGLDQSDFAKEHPFRNRMHAFGRLLRSRSSRPIGWIGIGCVILSVIFYLVFAIPNLEGSLPDEPEQVPNTEEVG